MSKFISRKLIAALVTGIIVALGHKLGLSEEAIANIVGLAVTYILGQTAVDTMVAFRAKPGEPNAAVTAPAAPPA